MLLRLYLLCLILTSLFLGVFTPLYFIALPIIYLSFYSRDIPLLAYTSVIIASVFALAYIFMCTIVLRDPSLGFLFSEFRPSFDSLGDSYQLSVIFSSLFLVFLFFFFRVEFFARLRANYFKILKNSRNNAKKLSSNSPLYALAIVTAIHFSLTYVRSSSGFGIMGQSSESVGLLTTIYFRYQSHLSPLLMLYLLSIFNPQRKIYKSFGWLLVVLALSGGLFTGSKSGLLSPILLFLIYKINLSMPLNQFLLPNFSSAIKTIKLRYLIFALVMLPISVLLTVSGMLLRPYLLETSLSSLSWLEYIQSRFFEFISNAVIPLLYSFASRINTLLGIQMAITSDLSFDPLSIDLFNVQNPIWYTQFIANLPGTSDFRSPGFYGLFMMFGPLLAAFFSATKISVVLGIFYLSAPIFSRIILPFSVYFAYLFLFGFVDGYFPAQDQLTFYLSCFVLLIVDRFKWSHLESVH